MGSLCLTMIYDIFEAHAQRDTTDTHSDRTAFIVKQLMALLATGISRTERDVSCYAERMNVSPKYLSATVKRVTGHSVTSIANNSSIVFFIYICFVVRCIFICKGTNNICNLILFL